MSVTGPRVQGTHRASTRCLWTLAPAGSRWARLFRWARRCALIGLIAYIGLTLHFVGVPTICSEEISSSGQVVRVCAEMGISNPRVAYLVLLGSLLLFPELSELEIGGLFKIKRRTPTAE